MEKDSDKTSLTVINEKSIFYKIKTFFLKLFKRNEIPETNSQIESVENNEIKSNNTQKEAFIESIKNIENEETKLLKLQQQYDNRLIETNELQNDEIKALIKLYKKQIRELSANNAKRKEKLLAYKNTLKN